MGVKMRKSILGKEFGKLTVIGYDGVRNKNSYWLCKCECGNEKVISRPSLISGHSESCGCNISSSLIGQRFGKLLVIDAAGKENGTTYWQCRCDCRRIVIVRRGHLTDDGTTSCGCSRKGKNSAHWLGVGDLSASFYRHFQQSAKRRKIDFDVGIEYLWQLFQDQNGKCALSGVEITLPPNNQACNHGENSASLDRIDSNKGYVAGNVQWLHKDVNFMKYKFDESYFLSMCRKMVEYKNLRHEVGMIST